MPNPVRVFWMEYEPLMNECSAESGLKRTDDCPNPGIEAEFVDLLLRHVLPDDNTTNVEIVPFDFADTLENRTFHVLVPGWVIPDKRDSGFLGDHQMSKVYTYINQAALVADTPRIPFWDEAFSVASVFGLFVWLLCLGTYVLLRAIDHRLPVLTFIRCRSPFRATHATLLVRTWLVFFLSLFTALYSNGLLAEILLKKDGFAFSNTEELVDVLESGRFRLLQVDYLVDKYMTAVQHANENGHSTLGRLKRVLRDSPETIVYAENITDMDSLLGLLYNNPYVVVIESITCEHLQRRYCGLHCVDIPEFPLDPYVFFLSNANPEFNIRFNDAIVQFWDSYDAIKQRYETSLLMNVTCDDVLHTAAGLEQSSALQSLSIEKLSGAFMMLAAGCVIGLLVCGMEEVASFVTKMRKTGVVQHTEIVESDRL